jgi:hypothetical protein
MPAIYWCGTQQKDEDIGYPFLGALAHGGGLTLFVDELKSLFKAAEHAGCCILRQIANHTKMYQAQLIRPATTEFSLVQSCNQL